MFGLLKSHQLVYEDRCDVGGGVTSPAFRSRRPINARAGQHGLLHLGATVVKPFSPASAPGEIEAGNIRQDKYLGYHPTARRADTSDP